MLHSLIILQPGITVLMINLSNSTSFDVLVMDDMNLYPSQEQTQDSQGENSREEYHLTPEGGNILSDVVLLNGTPLKLTNSLDIPSMEPKLADRYAPITVAPHSIVFATLTDFKAPACA